MHPRQTHTNHFALLNIPVTLDRSIDLIGVDGQGGAVAAEETSTREQSAV